MKKATAKEKAAKPAGAGEAPSRLIDARIRKLGDWRGETLARVRALIRQADPAAVDDAWRRISKET